MAPWMHELNERCWVELYRFGLSQALSRPLAQVDVLDVRRIGCRGAFPSPNFRVPFSRKPGRLSVGCTIDRQGPSPRSFDWCDLGSGKQHCFHRFRHIPARGHTPDPWDFNSTAPDFTAVLLLLGPASNREDSG